MKIPVKLLITRLLILCSIIGFITQYVQVSMQYFAFRTTTHVALSMPELIEPHAVALCIRFHDILDREGLQRMGMEILRTVQDAIKEEDMLTIEQIFDHTPQPDDTIASCTYRPDDWLIVTKESDECKQVFGVKKFFTQEFMCYQIHERVPRPIQMDAATKSTFSKGNIYTIYLNDSFRNMDIMSPVVFRGLNCGVSRDRAPLLNHLRDRPEKGSKQKFPFFYLTPGDVNIKRLQKPYDTGCVHVIPETAGYCRLNCLLKGLAPYARVPANELLTKKYKLKPLSTMDISGAMNGPKIQNICKDCQSACKSTACRAGFTVTSSRYRYSSGAASVGFSLTVPVESLIELTSQPTMYFVEFFSFLCTCIGTWFGVSFLSINSIRFLKGNKRTLQCPMFYR